MIHLDSHVTFYGSLDTRSEASWGMSFSRNNLFSKYFLIYDGKYEMFSKHDNLSE